jgi:hypothetical protein
VERMSRASYQRAFGPAAFFTRAKALKLFLQPR